MTLAPVSADLATALAEATTTIVPRVPTEGDAQVAVLTASELVALAPAGDEVAVAVRLSGAVSGDLVLLVPGDAAAALGPAGSAADQLALWEPALTELVSALGKSVGALQPEAVRQVDASTALAATPGAQQHAVAVVDDGRPVAIVVLTALPVSQVPQQRNVEAPAFQPLAGAASQAVDPRRLHLLRDVVMGLSVELGRTRMTVRELLSLTPGTIVQLDRAAGSPVDLLVNGTLIARGEVVVVDEEFAVRVSEIVGPEIEGRLGA
jgi:flagellar motor switch protein FliN